MTLPQALPAIKSKSDQVADQVLDWLRSGKFQIGDRLPVERKLAEMMGVSLLTVNKAMSRLEDAGLVSRVTGRGTHVLNLPLAEAIVIICDSAHLTGTRNTIFTNRLIDGLMATTRDSGVTPHFMIGRGRTPEEFAESLGLQSRLWSGVRGVISRGWRQGVEERLEERGVKVVTISSKDQGRRQVLLDYAALGRMAAGGLAERGARRCMVVHQPEFSASLFNNPVTEFRSAMEHGGGLAVSTRAAAVDPEPGLSAGAFRAIMDSGADGLFFTDENLTSAFFAQARAAGRTEEVLGRCSVVTHVTAGCGRDLPPEVTRLAFDVADISATSFDLLNRLMRNPRIAEAREFVAPKRQADRP